MIELDFLSRIIIILAIGLIIGYLAKRMKIPSVILLILTGVILKSIYVNGMPLFQLPHEFLLGLIVFILIIEVFNSLSDFSLRQLDTYSEYALKIAFFFMLLNILFFSIAARFIFSIQSVLLTLLLSVILSGTDPASILFLFKDKTNRILEILKYEALLSTPIIILSSFFLLTFLKFEPYIIKNIAGSLFPFFTELVIGIGTGIILAMFAFWILRNLHNEGISFFLILCSVVFSYLLAEYLRGNGIFAVAFFGIFFERVSLKRKKEIKQVSAYVSSLLSNVVFVLLGFILPLNLTLGFILKSLLLFAIMILLRFFAIFLVFSHENVNFKEKVFMSLNCTKGLSVAIIALFLSAYLLTQIPEEIINIIILFIFYSTALSSLTAYFSKYMIRTNIEE